MAGASPQVTFDSKATVERFYVFLSSQGLQVIDIFGKLPRRRVIVIIGWFCYLERIVKMPDVWRPGARRADKSNQGTDVLAQFAKKPTYVPAAEVYDGEKCISLKRLLSRLRHRLTPLPGFANFAAAGS